ncbi:MAG TPA: cytochrome c oxidase assembly protein [Solirubrobacteraceae bacterium]|nr:cytochrome c oxidase assembly protein [Solirubrobacteraceae bacterium]
MHLGESLPPELAFITYLVLYTRRAMTLHHEGRPVPAWRIVSFVFGVTTMTAVQVGPLDTLSDDVLVAHMAQHIFIGDIASLFVVLGLTGPVLAPLLHFRLTRPVRVLASPAVALTLWGLNLYGWHIPFMYQAAINHDLVHAVEHICFFWFGCLLWLALIGPLPKPAWFTGWAKLLYVIGVRFVGAVLGNVLIWASTVFYPVYRPTDAARGLNPLSDQNLAGGLMMVEEMILTTLILAWMFYLFAKQDEERQELMDLAAEHGIDLSDERAARAAASGQTDRLRERLLSGSSGPASGDG